MKTKLAFFLLLSLALNTFAPLTIIAAANLAVSDDSTEEKVRDIDIRMGVIERFYKRNTETSLAEMQLEIDGLLPLLTDLHGYLRGKRDAAPSEDELADLNKKIEKLDGYKNRLLEIATTKSGATASYLQYQPENKPDKPKKETAEPKAAGKEKSEPGADTQEKEGGKKGDDTKKSSEPIQIVVTNVPEVGETSLIATVMNLPTGSLKDYKLKFIVDDKEIGVQPITKSGSGNDSNSIRQDLKGVSLKSGQKVTYQVFAGKDEKASETIDVFTIIDATKGGLFAVMGGGVVASKQAQTTNEASPFTFFQVGYGTRIRGIGTTRENRRGKIETKGDQFDFSPGCDSTVRRKDLSWEVRFDRLIFVEPRLDKAESGTTKSDTDKPEIYRPVREFVRTSRGSDLDVNDDVYVNSTCEISFKPDFTPFTGLNTSRISYRLQGLFSSEGRASLAFPVADELPSNQPNRPFPFINNRQTFSTEITAWWEFRPLSQFSFGPYVTLGASTLLESAIKDKESIFDRETNQEVQSRVVTPVGTKFYGEIGAMQHLKFNPGKFFVQNFAGFGYYDQYRNAAYKFNDTPCTNNGMDCPDRDLIGGTRFRFVNKLRIFPYGFNPNIGRQVTVAPMFGVDLNVSKGPDNVRFFTGFVVNLGRFAGAPSQEQ